MNQIPPAPADENLPDAERMAQEEAAIQADTERQAAEADFVEATGMDMPPDIDGALADPKWLVKDWIPLGAVTMFAGEGGGGKSTLARQLALAVAASDPERDGEAGGIDPLATWVANRGDTTTSLRVHPEHRGRHVMFASYEDGRAWFDRTCMAVSEQTGHGFDFRKLVGDRLHYANLAMHGEIWGEKLSGDHGFTDTGLRLSTATAQRECQLLVLDTLAAAYGGNENDRHEVRNFLAKLNAWAGKHDCAVVVISHPSKSGNGAGTSGSTDWVNGVRSVIEIQWQHDPDDKSKADKPKARRLILSKANYAKSGQRTWLDIAKSTVVRDSDSKNVRLFSFTASNEFPEPQEA